MTIGERIKSRRAGLGLSQEQLATAIGKRSGTVSRYECNELEPRAQALRQLALALGCTTDDLVFGDEPRVAEPVAS